MTLAAEMAAGGLGAGPPPLHPICAHERVAAVDILRGLAIFGILTINAYYFSHPWFIDFYSLLEITGAGSNMASVDRAVYAVVFFLANETLYYLFAFLFAFGMATLMARAQARGTPFVRLYARRLLVLLAFGACHVLFLWSGDILITYAILGFVLLAFRRRADSTLIAWAGICLFIGVVIFAGVIMFDMAIPRATPAAATQPAPSALPSTAPTTSTASASTTASQREESRFAVLHRKWLDKTHKIYAQGTYGQVLRWRLFDYAAWTAMLIFVQYPRVFGMFLLGLWAGRRGILHDIPAHLPFIRKVAICGTILGVAASLVSIGAVWRENPGPGSMAWSGLAGFAGDAIRIPALCLALAAAIILLVQNDAWRQRLNPLAAVGQMSLSNYLLQSVMCAFIFYGYGLGLYGKVGPAGCLLLAIGIFLVQVPLSVLWLRCLRFGPAEWLWRTLTYGQLQPVRLPDAISSNQRGSE